MGAGKAAARMAAGCERALGADRLSGVVIVADGCAVDLASIAVRLAGHPIPDARGLRATEELCDALASAGDRRVLCLISGGASSVLVRPLPPVTLQEKMQVNQLLLASGAEIAEVNTTRKHLSMVKGGSLLRLTRARPLTTLVLSDVIGDDASVIGSGPTTPDPSTFGDALGVMRKYAIADRVAPAVAAVLERGARGEIPETLKPGNPSCNGATTVVIGNNRLALSAAADEARRLGYEPWVDDTVLQGETTVTARQWFRRIRDRIDQPGVCVIAGGETTVTVHGHGRGGRNQEFSLALVEEIAGLSVSVLSAGTDGIDGPTDAAGAYVDGQSLRRARAIGLDPAAALADNDSYGFFDRLGDLLRCGPTGTNVMDIKLAIGRPSSTT